MADVEFRCLPRHLKPHLFTQAEFNDLLRDLGLTEEKAGFLGSRLKEKHLLEFETSISEYRNMRSYFASFLSRKRIRVIAMKFVV